MINVLLKEQGRMGMFFCPIAPKIMQTEIVNHIKPLRLCVAVYYSSFFFGYLQWISVPFALTNSAVSDITVTAVKQVYQSPWWGSVSRSETWVWIDNFCLLVHFESPTLIQHFFFTAVMKCLKQNDMMMEKSSW